MSERSDTAEARAIRRRWITLGELVAVAGVMIAAASLWLSWSDRQSGDAERKAAQTAAARKAATVSFRGIAEHDGERVRLSDPAQPGVASIDVSFPRVLGIAPQTAIVDPEIAAAWLRKPLLDATDGGPDAVAGRMPVLVAATINDGDAQTVDRAIYDVLFATEGRLIGGRGLKLKGALFRQRVHGDATARLDALWAAEAKRLAALKRR